MTKRFKGEMSSEVRQILPYTLLSKFDHITAVKKSVDTFQECFSEDKWKATRAQMAPKAVNLALSIIKKENNAVVPQK